MTPEEFSAKWQGVTAGGRQAAQSLRISCRSHPIANFRALMIARKLNDFVREPRES